MESTNLLDNKMELIYKSLIKNPPLKYSFEKIKQLINTNGFDSIYNILELNFGENYKKYMNTELLDLISEINDITFIKSFSISNNKFKDNYLWEIPKEFEDYDKLEKKRNLYFNVKDNVYKIIYLHKNLSNKLS